MSLLRLIVLIAILVLILVFFVTVRLALVLVGLVAQFAIQVLVFLYAGMDRNEE